MYSLLLPQPTASICRNPNPQLTEREGRVSRPASGTLSVELAWQRSHLPKIQWDSRLDSRILAELAESNGHCSLVLWRHCCLPLPSSFSFYPSPPAPSSPLYLLILLHLLLIVPAPPPPSAFSPSSLPRAPLFSRTFLLPHLPCLFLLLHPSASSSSSTNSLHWLVSSDNSQRSVSFQK